MDLSEGKLVKKILLILIIVFVQNLFAQSTQFEKLSGRLKLNFRFPPPDTTNPTLSLKLPRVLDGYPIYYKDTILTIEGNIQDDNNRVSIFINDKPIGIFNNGPFNISTKLNYGENNLIVKAVDRKGNFTISKLKYFQDPNADMVPPIIQIEEPAIYDERGIKVIQKLQVSDTTFYLKGRISDESGILGLWINGAKVDSLANTIFVHKINSTYMDSISILAADGFGNTTQRTLHAKEDVPETLNDLYSNPNYHALLLAVEDYEDRLISDLDNPVSDAKLLLSTLTDYYTFEKKNVHLIENPTRQAIIKAFQDLREKLNQNDNLLIFYAGHGYYNEEIEQGYWLPSDAHKNDESNWIPSYTVRDFIKGIHTQHTLVISDACFAGAIFDTRNVLNQAPKSVQELYKYPSRKAMTSGLLNQVPDKSVFVEYIVKRLKENEVKYLDAEKLYISIKDAVIQNGVTNQRPEYKPIKLTGDEGVGQFIFIRR